MRFAAVGSLGRVSLPVDRLPFVLAFTGAHGVGKTSLARAVEDALGASESIVVMPEVPRVIVQLTGDNEFFRRGKNSLERQGLILAFQLAEEVQGWRSRKKLMICDRTVADHYAYTRVLFREGSCGPELACWESLVRRWLPNYDLIVGLRPEFPPRDDGVREDSQTFQAEVDATLFGFYEAEGVPIEEVSGTVEERTTAVLELVAARRS